MNANVIKRDGRIVSFDKDKIRTALTKASTEVEGGLTPQLEEALNQVTELTVAEINNRFVDDVKIYEIQSIVEQKLIEQDLDEIAKAYIEYRVQRDIERKQATDINHSIKKLAEKEKTIVNENANKDSRVFNTQRDLTAGVVAKSIGLKMLPKHVANAHQKGEIHFHDLDYNPYMPMTNCSLIDFKDMFENGFKVGNAQVGQPQSIQTAAAQMAQIIANVASSQYGGTTANRVDEVLAPYAQKNYDKHLKIAKKWINDKDKQAAYAKERTKKDIYDAAQSLEYEINTLYTSQGQTPFTTLGFGLGTSWIEREIQKAILQVRIKGLGTDKKTAIFPKLIFTLKDGVNLKSTDPNYDIKQLALECSTKRMYPDVLMYDKIVELTGSFKAPMGCVAGDEFVIWSDGNETHYGGISRLWEETSRKFEVKKQANGIDEYIDVEGITITDSHTGETKMTPVKRVIKNNNQEWLRVTFSTGRVLECTTDHPLPVKGRGRVFAEDLEIGDELTRVPNNLTVPDKEELQENAATLYQWARGVAICDGCLHEPSETVISYAYNNEDEIRERLGQVFGSEILRDTIHKRKEKGNYKEVAVKSKDFRAECINTFGGINKINRKVPNDIFNASYSERVYFLAGMIDADGYIHEKAQDIQIGSTNKELAYGQAKLMTSIGIDAKVYINRYNSQNTEKIRYSVSGNVTKDIIDALACVKKKDKYNPNKRRNARNTTMTVNNIEKLDVNKPSYDVTTASDYFDVSGIVSHNCRSFLQGWKDEGGNDVSDGRMNLGVVTLNLPRIAIESKGDKDKFWELLDERLETVSDALVYRINRVKETKPENAPILYQYGVFGKRLKSTDSVDEVFKNRRATVSMGYIGLYEVGAAFYGGEWEDSPEAKEFTLDVLRRMKAKADELSDEYGYHFSVYSTPAESLTDRFCRLDKEKFGSIENITDKDYYTNSFHYDVRKSPTPFEKLDFEKDYPVYASGGFIHYCEYPNIRQNPKALEAVWDYAYDKIGYLGTNAAIDHCYECGFSGEFEPTERGFKCVQCGNTDPETADVVKRTCGYLGNPQARPMVKGRHKEISARVKHIPQSAINRMFEEDGEIAVVNNVKVNENE